MKELTNNELQLKCEQKLRHAKVLQKLTTILANKPPQRVAMQTPQRVDAPSTSNDTTAPRIVRQSKRIHQRRTRSNFQMPSIPEEATYENYYDSPRSPRREKKNKQKQKQQNSPISQNVMPAPTFEEVPASGAPGPRVPVITQDDEMTSCSMFHEDLASQ
ncbi:hypothetical protein ACHAXR_003264 [Thalassiosira sp. AJA248-18]